jgi:outer membrane protein
MPGMKKLLLFTVLSLALASAEAQDLLHIHELALQHDPRLREAQANRDAALEARPQSIARLLPTVAMSGRLQRNSVLSKFQASQLAFIAGARNVGFWNSVASVNLTQPVYHHELWVQLAQADNQIAEAEANYAAEQQNLMLRTAQAYFDVLLAQDSLEFATAEQRAIGRQLEQAKARFEVGLIAITDVHEAQAGYDQARANAIAAANDLENAQEALREIVGEYSGDLYGLVPEVPLNSPRPDDIEEWNTQAQHNNLAIIAAENSAEVAKKNIDLQFAGHLPSIDLVGAAGFTDTNRPRGIPTEYQQIGMEVNVPLFAGGGVNSQVRQARHQFEAAQERLDTQRRAVRRQVKNAFRGIHTAIGQVRALQAAVVSSQSAVEATEAGFEVGTRTMVDVLAEQRNLFRTLRDYARTRYDYIVNSLSLKQAASALQVEDLALINGWLSADVRPKLPGNDEDKDDGAELSEP